MYEFLKVFKEIRDKMDSINITVEGGTSSSLSFEQLKTLITSNDYNIITNQEKDMIYNKLPVGTIIYLSSNRVPLGFVKANGALISRELYSDLFNEIGVSYGIGDGITTFMLPDLRGEFIRAWDDGRGIDLDRSLGSLQLDEIKSHNHFRNSENMQEQVNVYPNPWNGVISGAYSAGTQLRQHTKTGLTGGIETRPRNVALFILIKY